MSEDAYQFGWASLSEVSDPEDVWIRVSGGRLTQPIFIRLGLEGQRRFVSGLHMENGDEIRGSDLRFPLASIVEHAVLALAPDEPDFSDMRRMKEHSIIVSEWADQRMLLDAASPVQRPAQSRGRGATPPGEAELRDFVQLYLQELRTRPHGAMTRATKAFGMERVTGYRWLKKCRDLGLLPEEHA